MSHTPGPWTWCDEYYGGLQGQSEAVLMFEPYEGMWLPDNDGRGAANARLIAAAPDMLAALKAFDDAGSDRELDDAFDLARAVIAKAEGRS